ncbi:MAG: amidohydrolase family protein [Flavobacteriales bacterium]
MFFLRHILLFALLTPTLLHAQKQYLHCSPLIKPGDQKVLEKKTLLVQGDSILRVRDGYLGAKKEGKVLDLKGLTVMPGLMDMHVHLEGSPSPKNYRKTFTQNPEERAFESIENARKTVESGFTTVRDVGGSGVNLALREAIRKGTVKGPRVFSSGKAIGSTGGHADPTNGYKRSLDPNAGPKQGVADGVAQCKEAVRWRYKNGADLIKIMATGGVLSLAQNSKNPQYDMNELRAIVQTASDYGYNVAVHAHGAEGMKRAVKAGVHSIKHGTLMTEEVMKLMKKHGTWLVPTIQAGKFVAKKAEQPDYYPEIVRPKAKALGPKLQDMFAKAHEKGVKIAFGTDAGVFPHGNNWKEFIHMTEAGMEPMEALRTATVNGAKLLGIADEYGTLEAGKTADIIAVKGNPLENMQVMKQVRFVMKGGETVVQR